MNQTRTIGRLFGLSLLQGRAVINPEGKALADLKELLVDLETGRIVYAVVTVSKALNMGQRMLAVPWSAFHINPDEPNLVLNLDVQRIDQAPTIDERHWPDDWPGRHDRQWHLQTHQFYGVTPHWAPQEDHSA